MRPIASLFVLLVPLVLAHTSYAARARSSICCSSRSCNHTCTDPLEPVTAVEPGLLYIVKLPCPGCSSLDRKGKKIDGGASDDLLFNITLSHDRSSLLLNDRPIFPHTSSAFSPPTRLYAYEISPTFDYGDLKTVLECNFGDRDLRVCFRYHAVSTFPTDYNLGFGEKSILDNQSTVQWAITYDLIGLKHAEQKMLKILVNGYGSGTEDKKPDLQESSTLFGSLKEEHDQTYELEIADIGFDQAIRPYPLPSPLNAWGKVKHFFGHDPETPNHVVYIADEWGNYAKEGTLKELVGIFLFDWPWDLIGIIIASVLGSLVVSYGFYRLILLGLKQKRLAQWRGMDEVWRQMRAGELEGDHLLRSEYRDEPDDGLPPRYSAELPINKPLPSIPLPDKPLPAVPLIDDV
ncbi:uncharacterized protein EI97DRAFT_443465 [Westerdykella ornata]|uniref:Uncharacterized protein n=1 Tax=Westerdykella ornata TaxID=318751 RepID=A0A6A6JHW1_WESOR|nr:uncharacterized protein EI97DRAFT_443465 [Westerdykella ornata]KAF2275226.1 hypothetical protein EI97DRAFT_443465 [Westerdykella ornata]